jgi:hypothetical protein
MVKIYPINPPKISLFHDFPKIKCSHETGAEIPTDGKGAGGPVIYVLPPDQAPFFSLYAPERSQSKGDRER